MKRKALWVVIAAIAASAVIPFAANAANASRCPSWSGTADISVMSYRLDADVLPMSASMEVLEAAGGVTGQFASVSLPRGYRLTYSGNQVRLAKGGMMVIIR